MIQSYLSHVQVAGSPGSLPRVAWESLIGSRGFTTPVPTSTVRSMSAMRDEAVERMTAARDGHGDQTRRIGGRRSGARMRPSAISTDGQCQVTGAQVSLTTTGAAGTGTPIMKMQP
jgi:hypothetical protein